MDTGWSVCIRRSPSPRNSVDLPRLKRPMRGYLAVRPVHRHAVDLDGLARPTCTRASWLEQKPDGAPTRRHCCRPPASMRSRDHKRSIAIIAIEHVSPDVRDVDIHVTIPIVVGANTAHAVASVPHAGLFRDIFEGAVATRTILTIRRTRLRKKYRAQSPVLSKTP